MLLYKNPSSSQIPCNAAQMEMNPKRVITYKMQYPSFLFNTFSFHEVYFSTIKSSCIQSVRVPYILIAPTNHTKQFERISSCSPKCLVCCHVARDRKDLHKEMASKDHLTPIMDVD